ncbi:NADH:ubiquinone oxidoreductase intermediate-associated protein 30 [Pavlovales sp. CCMP2436]|nr:NADH:ubiquinone oxidoreductase intermediate-associated protein 30 [Pavlovales sp. CCMP2436]
MPSLALVAACMAHTTAAASHSRSLFDFTANPALAKNFFPQDDRVMGGRSVSAMTSQLDHARFTGELVLPGGGFASIRANAQEGAWDLSGSQGAELVVRGDGPPYKLVVRITAAPRVSYQQDFEPGDKTEWCTVKLLWCDFVPTYLGRVVPDAPKLGSELSQVTSVGFMLSKLTDIGQANSRAKDGPFRLDVQSVSIFP